MVILYLNVLMIISKMPGYIAGKKWFIELNMFFSNLPNKKNQTLSKSKHSMRSELLDKDDDSSILPRLPDHISKYCLALVPHLDFPAMASVCKRWRCFIQSEEFIMVRKLAGLVEEWVFLLTADKEGKGSHWELMDCQGQTRRSLPPMSGLTLIRLGANMPARAERMARRSDLDQYTIIAIASYICPNGMKNIEVTVCISTSR
ncbi:hypothetical protein S83_022590 [Arachis hypogaea]